MRILLITIALFSLPAMATEITQGARVYVTTNTDVDATAEAVAASGPKDCAEVTVCNSLIGGDVLYLVTSDSTLDATQAASVSSFGFPLYPTAASGETCFTVTASKNNKGGRYSTINSRTFYVAAGGIDSKASLSCIRW